MPNLMPVPWFSGFLLVFALRVFSQRYFSEVFFDVKIDQKFLLTFLGFTGVLMLGHNLNLFLEMGSDEPHHVERSAFLLKSFLNNIEIFFPHQSFESFLDSHWNLADPRVMSALDLWPLLFWMFIAILSGIIWTWHRVYRWKTDLLSRLVVDAGVLLALAGLGKLVAGWPDNHPPLRVLLPFISSGLFGMNNFSYRLSGLVALALFLVWIYGRVARHYPPVSAFFICLMFATCPTVFFNSILMEPAIYAFIGWAVVLIYLIESYENSDPAVFRKAVLLIPILILFRHTCVFLLFPAGLVYFLRFWRHFKFPWPWAVSFILLAFPYAWALKQIGNSAGATEFGIEKILFVFTNGKPLMSLLDSMGYLWSLLSLLLFLLAWRHVRRLPWLAVSWLSLFLIYHLVTVDTAWGIGRYQVEFLAAPLAATGFWLLKTYKPVAWTMVALSGVLAFATVNHLQTIPKNGFVYDYQALRTTNTSFLPTDAAINYIHRQKGGYGFLLIGGMVPTFESLLWFQGYDLYSSRMWLNQIYEYQQLQNQNPSWEVLEQYFKAREIKYLVLHNGLQRDLIGQTEPVKRIMTEIRSGSTGNLKLKFDRSYESRFGGILDIYAVH